jgi:hypothetical protein
VRLVGKLDDEALEVVSLFGGEFAGGTLSRIGDDFPSSASRFLYSRRKRELGSALAHQPARPIKRCDRNAINQTA